MTRDLRLTDEEIQVLQSTVIEKYKKTSIEQNNAAILLLDLRVPPSEIERLFKGCANNTTLEAFKDKTPPPPAVPPEPQDINFRQFDALVQFIRAKDEERMKYGNSLLNVNELWDSWIYIKKDQGAISTSPDIAATPPEWQGNN